VGSPNLSHQFLTVVVELVGTVEVTTVEVELEVDAGFDDVVAADVEDVVEATSLQPTSNMTIVRRTPT